MLIRLGRSFIAVHRRFTWLTLSSALGCLLFLPFLQAQGPQYSSPSFTVSFLIGSTLVAALCTFAGLNWADRADLKMPLLRAIEEVSPLNRLELRKIIIPSVVTGLFMGLMAPLTDHWLQIYAPNPGGVVTRLATTLYAAVYTEVVFHLFVMSGLVLLTKRLWIGLLVSAILFTANHVASASGSLHDIIIFAGLNASMALVTGWLYKNYGFEAAVLTHGLAHAITLGINC